MVALSRSVTACIIVGGAGQGTRYTARATSRKNGDSSMAELTESDLRALSEYRACFFSAYLHVFATIRAQLDVVPTGRPSKSTSSIVEKLRRESIRLTKMQDVAGLRIVVPLVVHQDESVGAIQRLFATTTIVDRRRMPGNGYRAVHIIVFEAGVPVEVQVRTTLQHLWAELSEKYADPEDPAVKYVPMSIRRALL